MGAYDVMQKQQKIIAFLEKDYCGKIGKSMLLQVEKTLKEMEEGDFSEDDLKTLKACYEAEFNDSAASTGQILTVGCVVFAVTQLLVSLIVTQSVWRFSVFSIILTILCIVFLIYLWWKVSKTSKETANLRNRLVAVSILLREKKSICR